MSQFNTTELDFDAIKENIKSYFKNSDSEFRDWDYEGSGLNSLLDILAYNTHYNAMLAHMSMNESFLDSAQLRANVVSRAKLLGYTPRSKNAATAGIDFIVTPGTAADSNFTIPKYTKFTTTISGKKYFFLSDVVTADLETDPDTGIQSYRFDGLILTQSKYEGPVIDQYYVDAGSNQRFVISDDDVDTDTLVVKVYSNPNSSDYNVYTKFEEFVGEYGSESTIYFLEENVFGKYEIRFGNNVFGKSPSPNSLVELEYIACDGSEANGATSFEFNGWSEAIDPDKIGSVIIDQVSSFSSAGSDREDLPSIKFNAPLNFISQKRAVTPSDYYTLISQNIGGIESLVVWGGEDEVPEDLGYVYICAKPSGTEEFLTDAQKTLIYNYLANKGIVGLRHKIVDPEYTYLYFDIEYKYNPSLTSKSEASLNNDISFNVENFGKNNLNTFDGVFRHSNFVSMIDNTNKAIINTTARIRAYKIMDLLDEDDEHEDDSPKTNHIVSLDFGFKLDGVVDQSAPVIINRPTFTASNFSYDPNHPSHEFYIEDRPQSESDSPESLGQFERPVFLVDTKDSPGKEWEIGTINLETGLLTIDLIVNNKDELEPPTLDLTPDTASAKIEVHVVPRSNDVVAKKAKIVQIDPSKCTYNGEVDTAFSNRANIGYNTFDRE